MKKKILALVLALAMVLGLAACGSSGSGSGSGSQSGSQTSNSDFKVGAIYINKKSDTAGYTYAHHTGITKAMKELGMDPETQLVIVDQVPEDDTQVGAAVDTLVGEGCSIIFGHLLRLPQRDGSEGSGVSRRDLLPRHRLQEQRHQLQ